MIELQRLIVLLKAYFISDFISDFLVSKLTIWASGFEYCTKK